MSCARPPQELETSLGFSSGPSLWRLVAALFRDNQVRVLVVSPGGTAHGRNIVSSCS